MFARAIAAAGRTHARVAGADVVYQRGEAEISLRATIGESTFTSQTDDGLIHEFQSRDFLIFAADLLLDEEPTLPERGDRIIETAGGVTRTYEVLPDTSFPAFRSDPFRQKLRVHTKLVATATADEDED